MSVTGNVKISALSRLSKVSGAEIVPCSWLNNGTYESAAFTIDNVKDYSYAALGLKNIGDNLNSYGAALDLNGISLGQYDDLDSAEKITITTATSSSYIDLDGNKVTGKSGFILSNEIQFEEGSIYAIPFTDTTAKFAVLAEVHTRNYYKYTGDIDKEVVDENGNKIIVKEPQYNSATDTIYEPLADIHSIWGGSNKNKYLAFLCPYNMKVVVSGQTAINGQNILKLRYSAFGNIAENFVSKNGAIAKVLAEHITELGERVENIEANTDKFGDISALSIDTVDYPKVRGEAMIIDGKGAGPSSTATATKNTDVPNRLGQIWIADADNAYISTSIGKFDGWKKLAFATS